MKSKYTFAVLIVFCCSIVFGFSIIEVGKEKKIVITKELKESVLLQNKGFNFAGWKDFDDRVLEDTFGDRSKESPMAVFQDFNFDKKEDAALILVKKLSRGKVYRAVALLSKKNKGFTSRILEEWTVAPDEKSLQYLLFVPKEKIKFKSVTLGKKIKPRNGFLLETYWSPVNILYCYTRTMISDCSTYIEKVEL